MAGSVLVQGFKLQISLKRHNRPEKRTGGKNRNSKPEYWKEGTKTTSENRR